jgi:hypothetical protein
VRVAQFPVPNVGGDHSAGPQPPLEHLRGLAGNRGGGEQRLLDLGDRGFL